MSDAQTTSLSPSTHKFSLAVSFDKRVLEFQTGESPVSGLVPFSAFFFFPNLSLTSKGQLIFTAGQHMGIEQGRQNRLRNGKKVGSRDGRIKVRTI